MSILAQLHNTSHYNSRNTSYNGEVAKTYGLATATLCERAPKI
jgi:hypothetical protein